MRFTPTEKHHSIRSCVCTHLSGIVMCPHPSLKDELMSFGDFKRLIVILVVMILTVPVFSGVAFALDPKKAITQYVHDAWTTEDGLP